MIYYVITDEKIDTEKAIKMIEDEVIVNKNYEPKRRDLNIVYGLITNMLEIKPEKRCDISTVIEKL